MDIKENIEALMKMWERGEISGYRIAKDLEMAPTLDQYLYGKRKIENMSLGKAMKLSEYYLRVKEEQDRVKQETVEKE